MRSAPEQDNPRIVRPVSGPMCEAWRKAPNAALIPTQGGVTAARSARLLSGCDFGKQAAPVRAFPGWVDDLSPGGTLRGESGDKGLVRFDGGEQISKRLRVSDWEVPLVVVA